MQGASILLKGPAIYLINVKVNYHCVYIVDLHNCIKSSI